MHSNSLCKRASKAERNQSSVNKSFSHAGSPASNSGHMKYLTVSSESEGDWHAWWDRWGREWRQTKMTSLLNRQLTGLGWQTPAQLQLNEGCVGLVGWGVSVMSHWIPSTFHVGSEVCSSVKKTSDFRVCGYETAWSHFMFDVMRSHDFFSSSFFSLRP